MAGRVFRCSVTLLPFATVLLSPAVLANLGQEIIQTGGGPGGVAGTVDVDGDNGIPLPELDDAAGLEDADGAAAQVEAVVVDDPFSETRLGAATLALPDGADPVEKGAQVVIAFWHQLTLDLQLADYSRVNDAGDEISDPENPGPCYSSKAMAIVHLAMYDAYVGVTQDADTYLTYDSLPDQPEDTEPAVGGAVAAGYAAAAVLLDLYSNDDDHVAIAASRDSFSNIIETIFAGNLSFVEDFQSDNGWPATVAAAFIADREVDGTDEGEAFVEFDATAEGATDTYAHVPDPTAVDPESGDEQYLYAPHWGIVTPFGHEEGSLPDPLADVYALTDAYLTDFLEIYSLGSLDADEGDNATRTADQTRTGLWWAYDGGFRIGVPPRLYNSLTDDVVITLLNDVSTELATGYQLVRLYAMVNTALADAGIAAWRDKYIYNFWRPIIGIRRADEDADTADYQDTEWVQLGAPNTNRDQPGINPAFPAYPSGHACFGTAVLTVVKSVLSIADDQEFEMHSDEFSGTAIDDVYCAKFDDCVLDPDNAIDPDIANKRPDLPRTLTIDAAIEENMNARLYLGVHWRHDQEAGVTLGGAVAEGVIANFPAKVA